MRYLINCILVAFLGMPFLFSGCEASDFEFDSGWDDNSAGFVPRDSGYGTGHRCEHVR